MSESEADAPSAGLIWREPSQLGSGTLAVRAGADFVEMLTPPGVPLQACDTDEQVETWRLARWTAVDSEEVLRAVDPPDFVLELSAAEAAARGDGVYSSFVRTTLLGQLAAVKRFCEASDGEPLEEGRARTSAIAEDAIRRALSKAFPQESWERVESRLDDAKIPRLMRELEGALRDAPQITSAEGEESLLDDADFATAGLHRGGAGRRRARDRQLRVLGTRPRLHSRLRAFAYSWVPPAILPALRSAVYKLLDRSSQGEQSLI